MKSGGPWNLRGLRPEARETARDAARRSGISVGEWLNSVIQPGDANRGEQMRFADYDDEGEDGWRDDRRRGPRHESRHESRPDDRHGPRDDYREPRRRQRREHNHDREREYAREREAAHAHEAALAREEFGEVHTRLDRLTYQLERMARVGAQRLTGAPAQPSRGRAPPLPQPRNGSRLSAHDGNVTVDAAIAEIAERQRALYGEPVAPAPLLRELEPEPVRPPPAPLPPRVQEAPPPSVQAKPEPTVDISNLEEQLRYITTRIESLRPTNELEHVISAFRKDLTDIQHQLTEALPRRAVESLEIEVRALGQRIDHSRESGLDSGAVAGLERGLSEVRDALRGLTPAENLVGFDDAVKTLAQKVDLIIAKEDPATLEQLETAIGALRGIVSHVASNDTLTKVAEDVRSLAAKVDDLANSAASGQAFSMLESRIDTLASALNASAEAGHAVPRDLEKLLSGLIEKLEWVQLTHTDHAALGHLEDRIAQLIKRLDASDAKLGNLEAVERGLADLLVHIDHIRGGSVAEIKRSERRTLDSIEAVHGTVEHVVDRLAMIENDRHDVPYSAVQDVMLNATPRLAPGAKPQAEPIEARQEQPPAVAVPARAPIPAAAPAPMQVAAEPAHRQTGASRKPIDPSLPPDHPLEPGSMPGTHAVPSAADRIAASEAAAGYAKPPETAEKPNFIAAARRAAQAAAAAAPERQPRTAIDGLPAEKSTPRLRKLLVAGGAILLVFGCVHIAMHMFQDTGSAVAPSAPERAAPPAVLPDTDSTKPLPPQSGPLVLPIPGVAPDTAPSAMPSKPESLAPEAVPSENSAAAPPAPPAVTAPATPARQSALHDSNDVTGSLPRHAPSPWQGIAPVQAPADAAAIEKLPATIGGPLLRAAALAGDAAAEFEVATRFAEGHGVSASNEQAARWLERAAKQGLAPAQFRLGGLYEKGIGVKKDLAAARDLYKAAAEKGNGKAMHNLAVLYAEGVNGPADYRTAAHWFRKAADRGITDSQYNLAILYARGIGVEQNYAESYKWFVLAANAGDNEAAKKRDEVASHLDPQSLAAVQAAVQKWSPEPQQNDAVGVKTPPGGWDPPQAAKSKVRVIGAKAATPASKVN